ncbi:MAG TPA: PQQ-binding-like beta-propeller repeat protein [Bdellovibrionota bacterium]|nr:PQQ-binding-like beta-propeller repeat protein [Bdellovibrionota bacterium]
MKRFTSTPSRVALATLALVFVAGCSSSKLGVRSARKSQLVHQDSSLALTRFVQPPHVSTKAWQWRSIFALGAPMQSMVEPVALGGGEWIVVTLGGGIGRWNLEKGFARWQIDIDPGVASRPLVSGNNLYFAGMDAQLRKVNLSNGSVVWTRKLTAESLGGIAASGGFLFVNTADDTLAAIDEKTGNMLWTYKRPSTKANVYWSLRGQAVPTLSKDGKKLFLGFSDGTFVALEAISGQTLWERKFEQVLRVADVDLSAVMSTDQSKLFMVHADGALYALNTSDGSVAWTMAGASASAPFLDDKGEYLYQGTRNGEVRKLSARNGSVVWTSTIKNPGHLSSVRKTDSGLLVFSGSHAGIFFVNESNGRLVHEVRTGYGPIAPAAIEGDRIFVISPRNNLMRFRYIPTVKSKS